MDGVKMNRTEAIMQKEFIAQLASAARAAVEKQAGALSRFNPMNWFRGAAPRTMLPPRGPGAFGASVATGLPHLEMRAHAPLLPARGSVGPFGARTAPGTPQAPPTRGAATMIPIAEPVGPASGAMTSGGGAAAGAGGAAAGRRGLSLGTKLLGGAAATGLGALGLGHVNRATQWNVGGDPFATFQRNNDQFNQMAQPLLSEIENAYSSGDVTKAQQLQQQLSSGDFGGSMLSLGGLNPFATPNASYFRQNALGAQQSAMNKYKSELAKFTSQPGDQGRLDAIRARLARGGHLPAEAKGLNREMEFIRKRMNAKGTPASAQELRRRMEEAGMTFNEPTPPPSEHAPSDAAWYGLGPRPSGAAQGYQSVFNSHDYTPY